MRQHAQDKTFARTGVKKQSRWNKEKTIRMFEYEKSEWRVDSMSDIPIKVLQRGMLQLEHGIGSLLLDHSI